MFTSIRSSDLSVSGDEPEEARVRPHAPGPVATFARNRVALAAAIFVLLLIAIAIAGRHITPRDPNLINTANRLKGPSSAHWLGTDNFGRDTLSRLMVGARTSLRMVVESVFWTLGAGGSRGLAPSTAA